jgi:hypothetical protein
MTVVLIGILINNSRLGDVKDLLKSEVGGVRSELANTRDVLRAEMDKNHSEMLHRFADLDTRMTRIENSLGMNRS